MNCIPEVAKMLGVEIGEEFKIESGSGKNKYPDNAIFKFDKLYLKYKPHDEWILATCAQSDLINGKLKLVKIPKPILNEKEKEYLSYVIRPFRKKIEYIIKNSAYCPVEWITIKFKDGQATSLPQFEKGTMYKGMELVKEYGLEELGL